MADDNGLEITTTDAILGFGAIRFFGVPVKDMKLGVETLTAFGRGAKGIGFAQVRAVERYGKCIRLPVPLLLFLPGGRLAKDEPCARPGEWVWDILPSDTSVVLDITTASIEDILKDIETYGIKGGVKLENVTSDGSKICATVHIWAEIKVFGQKIGVDQRIPFCIPLQGCHTVFEAGIARVRICFKVPNQICAELCVGAFGLEKCWEECLTIPLSLAQPVAAECNCHKA